MALAALALLCDAVPAQAVTQSAPQAQAPAVDPKTAAYREFKRLFDAREYDKAVPFAQQIVDMCQQQQAPGGSTEDLQIALMNLGAAQNLSGDHVGAEASFQRVIGIIESEGRMSSPRLARAVAGLATNYYAARRYEVAIPQLERAVALNRRAEGLFNTDQLPLLASQADALTQVGRYQEALRAQDYRVRVVERAYGPDDPRISPTLESVGRWYTSLGAYEQARRTIKRALIVVEKARGPKDLALVGPLTALADAYNKQLLMPVANAAEQGATTADQGAFNEAEPLMPFTVPGSWKSDYSDGVKLLERAQAIVTEQPSPSPAAVAEIETLLGDWYQARLQVDRARLHYARAWHASNQAGSGSTKLSETLFGRPTLLHYVRPSWSGRLTNSSAPNVRERSIEIELTVDADGRPKDPKVISAEMSERMTAEAIKAAQSARYRPRIESGTPVETTGVIFRESYRVVVEEDAENG